MFELLQQCALFHEHVLLKKLKEPNGVWQMFVYFDEMDGAWFDTSGPI